MIFSLKYVANRLLSKVGSAMFLIGGIICALVLLVGYCASAVLTYLPVDWGWVFFAGFWVAVSGLLVQVISTPFKRDKNGSSPS